MASHPRENLIKAAQKLFGEKGFDGASVRDIARKAKTNVAMIAYYFGCKERLYMDCLGDFAMRSNEALKHILTPPRDSADLERQLQLLIATMMSMLEYDGSLLRMMLREMQSDQKPNKELLELMSPFFYGLRDYFQQGIDQKIIPGHRSADFLTMIFLGGLSYPIQSEIPLKKLIDLNIHNEDFKTSYSKQLLEIFIKGALA